MNWFSVFLYKVTKWLFVGIAAGTILAEMQGYLSVWFLFVYIPGIIGMTWMLVQVHRWSGMEYPCHIRRWNIFQGHRSDIRAMDSLNTS